MIGINQLRWSSAQPGVAQPHRSTTTLFLSAVSYLRGIGISAIQWLNIEGEAYEVLSDST
jgi:hypothetical protein